MFLKSANPLNFSKRSTIRALFKAKAVDPKTYSPTSLYNQNEDSYFFITFIIPLHSNYLLNNIKVILFSFEIL